MCAVFALGILLSGCSVQKMAMRSVSDALGSEESLVFTGDDDPQLVGDALPFALKMYETLLEKDTGNVRLAVATGKTFAMYAFAFVQSPAERLGDSEIKRKKAEMRRAKKLYLRGRDYLLSALETRYPGFRKQALSGSVDSALMRVDLSDTTALYWTGAAWMGAITVNTFDFGMLLSLKRAVRFIDKVAELNDGFGKGSVHDFYISYYGSLPKAMGGSEEKARFHFAKAVEMSGGTTVSPYVALATSVSVKKQDVGEFRELLGKALAVDVKERTPNRLANMIGREKAQWLLVHIDDFFLFEESENEAEEKVPDAQATPHPPENNAAEQTTAAPVKETRTDTLINK